MTPPVFHQAFRRAFVLLPLVLFGLGGVRADAQGLPQVRVEERGLDEAALTRVFDTLDPSRLPTGLLYDRVLHFVDAQRFDGSVTATPATLDSWRQLYHELARSGLPAARAQKPGLPPLAQLNRAASRYLNRGLVPLAILHVQYDVIKERALQQNLLSLQGDRLLDAARAASPYETRLAFAAAALKDKSTGRTVRFVLPPDLYVTHGFARTPRFRIDFDDGRGARPVRPGEVVAVTYATGGSKTIRVLLAGGPQPLQATTTLAVRETDIPPPDLQWLNQQAERPYADSVASYDAYIFFGTGNTRVTRPVVFVEGFDPYHADPAKRRTVEDIYEILMRQDFIVRLRALGYDAVIMKLANATDYIQRNAFALEHLLNRLRTEMPAGEQTVIVGPSMGGIIGLYTLAYMEHHDLPHNVRLFASLDSPHRGANIPLGDQYFIEFFDNDSELAFQGKLALNSPAARQLLVYQYRALPNEDPLRTVLLQEMDTYGFPDVRSIAVASGSGYGVPQQGNSRVGNRPMQPGDKIVEYRYRSFFIDLDGDVWALPDSLPETQIFEGRKDVIGPHYRAQNVYVIGSRPYDNAPGGRRSTQDEIAENPLDYGTIYTSFPDHAWIPTTSALDLPTSNLFYDLSTDPRHLVEEHAHGAPATATFDAIYYPADNQDHVEATEENVRFLLEEIDTTFPASRLIAGPRTFNSGQRITVADHAVLTFDGDVQVAPGVHFALGRGAKIVFNRPVLMQGTADAPVIFAPSGRYAWNTVALNADANQLEHVVSDGAIRAVEVRSKDNVFRHCRFENSRYGVYSYYTAAGARSSFRLENSIVRGNQLGIVAYHADLAFDGTIVRRNGGAGIWLYNALVDVFHQSVVDSNALGSTRSGIELLGGSYVHVFGPDGGRGYTRIANNGYHEIYVSRSAGGLTLGRTDHGVGGYNSVFDVDEGSLSSRELLIRSLTDSTVYAHETYWGGITPGRYDLEGRIAIGPVLSTDPTAEANVFTAQLSGTPKRVSPSSSGTALRTHMHDLRAALGQATSEQVRAPLLRALYALQRLDPQDALAEQAANLAALRASGSEAAVLLQIRHALLSEQYAEAGDLLQQAASLDGVHRSTLLLERIALLEHEGRYAEALALFEQLERDRVAAAEDPPALYALIGETLQEELAAQQAPSAEAVEPSSADTTSPDVPDAFVLAPAHPNPLRQTATLSFSLRETAAVRVEAYDALGRRVAVLADASFAAGTYPFTFTADGLASGMYVVRAQAASVDGRTYTATRTLILLK